MAKPITNRVKMGKTPVIRKDLEGGVIAEANNDGSIYVDKSVKKGSPLEKEAIAHEKVHLNQMKRGDLNYDDNNVYWKGKAYPRSSMNEGAKNLPWEKEAYDKTKHMKKNKKSAPTKMSDADLVANNYQVHPKFSGTNESFQKSMDKFNKTYFKKPEEDDKSDDDINVDNADNNNTDSSPGKMKATPITLKSRGGYNSPLNYNSPLKVDGDGKKKQSTADEASEASKEASEKVDQVVGPDNKVYNRITKESASTSSGTSSESSSQPKTKKLPTDRQVWNQNIGNVKGKYTTFEDYQKSASDWRKQNPNYNKEMPSGGSKKSSESSSEGASQSVSYQKVDITEKGDPGFYNPGFWMARNTEKSRQQQEKTGNAIKREAKRDLVRKYRKAGVKLPGKRKTLFVNPDNPTEFLGSGPGGFEARLKSEAEWDAKFKKSYKPLNKIVDATPDKTRQATSGDAGYENLEVDANAGVNSSSKESKSSNKKNNSPANMKTPFKMGGFGSKNKNN